MRMICLKGIAINKTVRSDLNNSQQIQKSKKEVIDSLNDKKMRMD